MADGANLELNISASQDASVHRTFTALTKLLERLDKHLGSLNSSIEKLAKLKKFNEAVTASIDKTTASIDKQSAVSEKAAKKAEKDAERIARAKEKEAERVAKAKEREAKRLEKEAERAEREAERLLEKERRRRDQEIKQQERNADRLAKLEAKNKRDLIKNNYGDPVTSKTYMTNQHDTFNMMDMYHRKLEQINREDERGTKLHGDKLIALQRTEDAFQKLLRPIDEAVKRKTAITDTLEKLIEFRNTNPESVSPKLNSHIDNLLSKVDTLGSVINRQAFREIADSFDFNRVFEKNLKAVQKSHIFTETEKHIQELGTYGSHTIDIYKNITKNMEDGSQQRAIAFRDVKQFGKWVEDNINTMSANIATLYSAESPDYARIEELKARKDAFEDMAKSIGKSQQTFDKFRSSFKDDLLPITSVQKHTDDLVSKHGEQAKTLFNFLNEGLDENSKRIKQNATAVTKYFTDVEKEKAKVEADLSEKLTERASAKDEDQIKALDKGIDTLRHRVAELQHSLSDEGIIEAFLGKKSGRTAAFKSLDELMGSIPLFKKRIDEIRNSTEHGSVEQREAINKLKKDFTEYNKILGTTSQLTAIASSNLEHLKRNNAAEDTIKKHQTVLRELEGIRKNLTNTFSGVSDFGASTNISNLMKRFSGILTSDSSFGEQARGLFADVDVKKLGSLEVELKKLHTQYNNVVPTIAKFAEVNDLSAEQVAKLNSAEFIQQASLQRTKDGVRKLAEEYLGFHKTSRTSIKLFDRMASSMGNMARYAFSASIYYAFENAIFSTIDAVAKFDQSLKNLQAITDATDNEVAALGEEIKRVAVETRYGINEVADGATIIGQAGYSATETMSILGSAMNLAQGSMSTVTASADLLTTVLASFNLQASDAAMVADNMAAAMNYSKLDIDKLRTAFNYVGPVAMDAGASLQEMSAVLMVLANNGMKASTIGTSLRNVFSQLQSPSGKLRKAFEEQLGSEEAAKQLAEIADKSTAVSRKFEILNGVLGTNHDLFKLFGLRAAGTVSILTKYYTQIAQMEQGLYTLGEAERMADKQMEGLANRLSNLSASLEVLGVTISEQPSKALSEFVLLTTKGVQTLTTLLDGPLGAAIVSFGTLAGVLGTVVAAGRLFTVLFGVKLITAITTANTAIAMSIQNLGLFATASTGATGALTGLSNAFLRFSASHPILAFLSAVTVAIGAMWGAWKVFWEEDDKATTAFQQNMKKRREEIGLLRTALSYNEKITDDNKRSRNNAYVASNVPEIAESLYNAGNKEETRDILTARIAQTESAIINDSVAQAERSIATLSGLYKKRDELLSKYKDIKPSPVYDDPALQREYESIHGSVETQRKRLEAEVVAINERIKQAEGDAGISFRGILDSVEKTAQEAVNSGMGVKEAWDAALSPVKAIKWETNEAAKAFEEATVIRKEGFFGVNNIAVAGESIEGLSFRLHRMGLEGATIVKTYESLGANMGVLVKEVQKAEKAFENLDKAQMSPEDKERAKQALIDQYNAIFIKRSVQNKQQEIAWVDKLRQHEIDSINATSEAKLVKEEKIKEINQKYYAEEKRFAEEVLRATLEQIITLNQIAGVDVEKTFTLLVEGKYKDISPEVWKYFLTGGHTDKITQVWQLGDALDKSRQSRTEEQRFGVVPKREYEAEKRLYDKSIIEAERAYNLGEISGEQYTAERIAAKQTLLEKQEEYVNKLNATIKTEADLAKYDAERAQLIKDKAQAAYDAEILRIEQARYEAEKSHNIAMFNIDAEAAALENRDMNESDRQTGLLKLEGKRIQQQIDYINEQLESKEIKNNEKKATELQLELEKQKLELQKNQVAQERLAYEIRTKYIEQEYKYGLQTQSAYRNNIRKQMEEGTVNPYDAQKQLWLDSNDPLDGYKHGIASIAESTKTMNEYISEGVQNFRDEWHSAMDEFVDSWWDGTKSAEEIFGDFINNLARDWTKKLLQMYSDEMFAGFAKSFLGGNNGWLSDNYMNYGGGRTPSIGIATPAIAEAVTPKSASGMNVDTTGLQLSFNSTLQNVQTTLGTTSASVASDVSTMADESTQLLTGMADGASNLWSFLANGFSGLWGNISSGISGILSTIAFATTSSSGGSFWERWLGNSIGMGFKLFGSYGTPGADVLGGPTGAGTDVVSGLGWNAKGNVFKGLSDFSNSVVSSPTLFTYGEHLKAFAKGAGVMGEAGPEAIMPLTRDGNGRLGVSAEGMGGAQCINNIYIETPEGYTAEQTSRVSNSNGGEDIMFTIVKQTAANVAQPGSPMYRAMQNTFGASQVLTSR